MNYQDIQKVNSEVKTIDLKGKDYAMVPERVTAFRKLFPEGFILTDIISHDGQTVMMQAKAGYYLENGEPCVLGSGYAQEVKGRGMVNGTSYIENCETSAVGRALGFLGLGINGGGICSAEELANAVVAQGQLQEASVQKEQTKTPTQPVQQQPEQPEQPKPQAEQQQSDRTINIKSCILMAEKQGRAALINENGYRGKPWDKLTDDEVIKVKLWLSSSGKKAGAA